VSKKILAAALAVAMVLGLASVALAASPFPDTAGIPEEADIALLKTLKLVKGDDLGYFRPEDTINRAEFCAMIVRALGLEGAATYLATPTVFPDVAANFSWAYGYINVAVTKGVVKGHPDGTFKPADPVKESEALTMIMRALGYKDSLPGDWPLDYIIEGAKDSVGLVKAGFVPNVSATRAFVAGMIATMLDCKPVTEDKDNPGNFVAGANAFKVGVLSVKTGPDGLVSVVDKTNSKITIGGTEYVYDSAVAVAGKVSAVGDLVGYKVTTVQKTANDKIVFIATSVKDYITGKVTAVDVVNSTLTIGGVTYTVTSDFAGTKNGAPLDGTVANKLVALLNTTANLWLNTDGKAYRAEGRYLSEAGVVSNKTVSITGSGTVYSLTFVGDVTKTLASSVTITRNGASAGWSDLKVDDDCQYALVNGEIVWLDAWNQVVSTARVIGKYDLGNSTWQVAAIVGGETKTYLCSSASVFNALTTGNYYNLLINRDGKIYGSSDVSSDATAVVGVIASMSTETTWVDNAAKTVYKVVLTDGTSLDIPFDASGFTLKRNNGTVPVATPYGTLFTDNFKVGDSVNVARTPAGKVSGVQVFSAVFTGTPSYAAGTFKVDGNTVTLKSGGTVTLDGKTSTLQAVGETVGAVARVYWDAAKVEATKVVGVKLAAASAVSGISSNVAGTYTFTLVNGTSFSSTKDAIVLRDGVESTLAAVQLGDKVQYGAAGEYVEVTTDTKAPKLDSAFTITAEWTAGAEGGDVKVTVKFNEEVQKPTIYVAGVKSETVAAKDANVTWTATVHLASKPGTVSIAVSAKDFAGNAYNDTVASVTVSVP